MLNGIRAVTLATLATASVSAQTEMSQKDEPALFKARVNLVQVPVVVRDRQGKAIGTLKKEDFLLFDKGKPQYIARFSVEKASGRPLGAKEIVDKDKSPDAPPSDIPDRFIAYLFDDVHSQFGELAQTRDAVQRQIDTGLRTTDRAAIFTTSGQTQQDFTDSRDDLHRALAALRPRPVTGQGLNRCPNMTYYIADQMENKRDPTVIQAVTLDTLNCNNMTPDQIQQAQQLASAAARNELSLGDHETRLAMGVIRDLIRRMAAMPGQRTVILISSGFLTLPEHATEKSEIMDRAIKANVLLNALDARGLYTYTSDITRPGTNAVTQTMLSRMDRENASANADVMAELAAGTGATFVQNSNDFDGGLRRLATAPEYYYLLAFSPQNLRMDGSFHSLKVTLAKTVAIKDAALSARKGYYAPTHTEDAKETARRELEEALFSRDEMADIPIDFATQFFKPSSDAAKISVLIKLDIRKLKYRKEEDRNKDELTLVCGLFDRNGVYVTGIQKLIEMRLKDETLEKRLDNGITIRNTIDAKPGQYSIRIVVRDAEGQLMSARNGAVDIPYQ
ncbi:MAG TPA: VWA domain-containing protein [Candidatus Acidoferrales bacterium]|nr:VWA domain-containing protein [Candidatus Acidoferrales bacterium]